MAIDDVDVSNALDPFEGLSVLSVSAETEIHCLSMSSQTPNIHLTPSSLCTTPQSGPRRRVAPPCPPWRPCPLRAGLQAETNAPFREWKVDSG